MQLPVFACHKVPRLTLQVTVQIARGVHTMPLAVIIDDRQDVWQKGHIQQLVQANQFMHYETAARAAVGQGPSVTQKGKTETQRLLRFLQGIRHDQFQFWRYLYSTIAVLMRDGVPNAFWAVDMERYMCVNAHVNVKGYHPKFDVHPPPKAKATKQCGAVAPASLSPGHRMVPRPWSRCNVKFTS